MSICDRNGKYINPSHVRSIKDVTLDRARCELTLSDGETAYADGDADRLYVALLPVVPAQPGFVLVRAYYDTTDKEGRGYEVYERLPIVAWRIGHEAAIPVTCSRYATASVTGSYDEDSVAAVVSPEGTVHELKEDEPHESVEDWVKALNFRRKDDKAA